MKQEFKQKIYKETQKNIKRLFKNHLKKFILYGSYARNDEDDESDIDFCILTDLSDDEIKKINDKINIISCDLSLKYGPCIQFIEININHYYEWLDVLPFYQNVKKEGIVLYEGR